MKIIKDNKITIDFENDDEWDKIRDIVEPSLIIYEAIRPSFFNNFLKKIDNISLSKPTLFVRKTKIESYPEVIADNKNIVKKYSPYIVYENEYSPIGIIYVDKYKKMKKDETIHDMIENLIKENRLEAEVIEDE
jgi:hypothetical protein